MRKVWTFLLLFVFGALAAGCNEPTTLAFKSPTGTKMTLEGQEYTWPCTVTLDRPIDVNEKLQYNGKLTIPCDKGMINVPVEVTLFPFKDTGGESDNTIELDRGQLQDMYNGKSITIRSETKQGDNPKYVLEFNKR